MTQDPLRPTRPRPRSRAGWVLGFAVVFVLVVGALWRSSVERLQVVTESMAPALVPRQWVTLQKRGPSSEVERGDIVAFDRNHGTAGPRAVFFGRVVGVPGDLVELQARRLRVNGKTLERTACNPPQYVTEVKPPGAAFPTRLFAQCELETLPSRAPYRILFDETQGAVRGSIPPTKIPPDQVYVLGDNRDHSEDSRQWGPIPLASVLGRVTRLPFKR